MSCEGNDLFRRFLGTLPPHHGLYSTLLSRGPCMSHLIHNSVIICSRTSECFNAMSSKPLRNWKASKLCRQKPQLRNSNVSKPSRSKNLRSLATLVLVAASLCIMLVWSFGGVTHGILLRVARGLTARSSKPWCCLRDAADRQYEAICGSSRPHARKNVAPNSNHSIQDSPNPAAMCPVSTLIPIFNAVLPLQANPFSDAVVVGHEAWHYSTLNDLLVSAPNRCGFDDKASPFIINPEAIDNEYPLRPLSDELYHQPRRPLPFIYNGYTKRLPERRKRAEDRLSHLTVNISNEHEVTWMTFGEGDRALQRRDWLGKHVWKKASSAVNFSKNQLSTCTVFEAFDHIASESEEEATIRRLGRQKLFVKAGLNFTDASAKDDDEVVMFLEDDAFPVYRFRDKFEIFYDELSKIHPHWDIAWLGTCFSLHRHRVRSKANSHAVRMPSTRCFNAVMFKRRVAVDMMRRGSSTDEYLPIDHLFNSLIVKLPLYAIWALPPLFYEGSKALDDIPC